jgi:hypothetical protein
MIRLCSLDLPHIVRAPSRAIKPDKKKATRLDLVACNGC